MRRKIKNRFLWLRNSGVAQTIIGFFIFLIIASVLMLFLEASEINSGIKNLFASLWFSIVTVTTVGYGDLSPVSSLGKVAAVVIMLIGILYIGVITGNITSWLVERNRRRVFGLVPVRKKEGHFLILGWRSGMAELLKDILRLHNKDANYLVLVNSANIKEVNELRQDNKLKELSYFSGDYTNKEVLQNVCCSKASKVLILSGEDSRKNSDEIDFKTVLATIAIKRLNPQVYAIVEIIQPKFALYLQHVEAEEIILNQSSSRALLSNIALMSGLNNVFSSFFSQHSGLLKIVAVDEKYNGRSYGELKSSHDVGLILGLVENSGNLRKIKLDHMNSVSRSVSIKKAIQGLNELKTMQSNIPLFHPSPNYTIKENSSMIVLKVDAGELNTSEFSTETVIQQKSVDVSIESYLRHQIIKSIERAKTWNLLVDMLDSVRVEFYQYANQINGVIFNNRKYPFAALNFLSAEIKQINELFESKRDIKTLIKSKIRQFLNTSLDWDGFFNKLRNEGMDFYLYRSKINGIQFEGKKFSFKTLDIAPEISEEINKIKTIRTETGGVKKRSVIKQEHGSLASMLNELRSKSIEVKPGPGEPGKYLMICGWKPQLPEMISFIISQYHNHEAGWNKISIVANIDIKTAEEFNSSFNGNVAIELYHGSAIDRELLKKAGIGRASKVIILAETESGKSIEEIDSQTVLTAMMISSLNKKAYKVAEILDKRYKESLEQANVEEIYLKDEFTRIMLSNGSHGAGITRVISELVNFRKTTLRTRSIGEKFVLGSFRQLLREMNKPGELVIGLLEETGNINVRKSERIHQAQIQSNISGQVEELIKVKELKPNRVVIAPGLDYIIPPHSQLISLISSDQDGWKYYQNLKNF